MYYKQKNPVVNGSEGRSLKTFCCSLDNLYASPRWMKRGGGFGFVFNEKDLKNKHLDQRLALHFTLCAPNLFGRSKDVIELCKFLAPDSNCTPYMLNTYRNHLKFTGLVTRKVARYNKKKSSVVNTGTLSSFRSNLDFKEDYCTILLMHKKGSVVHLLNKPKLYLKSPFVIEHFERAAAHSSHTEFYTFAQQKLRSNAIVNNPEGSSINNNATNNSFFLARLTAARALAMLRNTGHQTFIPNYWMNDATLCVYKYFKRMCLRLLRNQNMHYNTLLRRVESHYGPLHAIWLRNALAAFRLLVANGKFRIGRGRPRVHAETIDDIVNVSVAFKVVNNLCSILFKSGALILRKKDRFQLRLSIYHYVYEKLNFIKRSSVLSYLNSCHSILSVLMKQSLDSFRLFLYYYAA